jgi:hypothetical protein
MTGSRADRILGRQPVDAHGWASTGRQPAEPAPLAMDGLALLYPRGVGGMPH